MQRAEERRVLDFALSVSVLVGTEVTSLLKGQASTDFFDTNSTKTLMPLNHTTLVPIKPTT